jgi:hypothetical protein
MRTFSLGPSIAQCKGAVAHFDEGRWRVFSINDALMLIMQRDKFAENEKLTDQGDRYIASASAQTALNGE